MLRRAEENEESRARPVRGARAGHIVAIRPFGKGLLMETLRFADEVKKASTTFDDIPAKRSTRT